MPQEKQENPSPSLKDPELYEELREDGASRSKGELIEMLREH